MPFCTSCGAQMDENARFCTSCGALAGQAGPSPGPEPEPDRLPPVESKDFEPAFVPEPQPSLAAAPVREPAGDPAAAGPSLSPFGGQEKRSQKPSPGTRRTPRTGLCKARFPGFRAGFAKRFSFGPFHGGVFLDSVFVLHTGDRPDRRRSLGAGRLPQSKQAQHFQGVPFAVPDRPCNPRYRLSAFEAVPRRTPRLAPV